MAILEWTSHFKVAQLGFGPLLINKFISQISWGGVIL